MVSAGDLYVIAAPSGTGKTTLVKALTESLPHIMVSISHTTRTKRPNEREGHDYHFINKNEFETMIQAGDFFEYATIFDHYYGTSKSWVKQTLAKGMDVILEIDWQGHQQVKRLFPEMISIFILPPSLNDLQKRLTNRNQDHPDIIKKRLADAKEAVSHAHEFTYIVINDTFSKALHDLKTIVEAAHLRERRQALEHADLLRELMKK